MLIIRVSRDESVNGPYSSLCDLEVLLASCTLPAESCVSVLDLPASCPLLAPTLFEHSRSGVPAFQAAQGMTCSTGSVQAVSRHEAYSGPVVSQLIVTPASCKGIAHADRFWLAELQLVKGLTGFCGSCSKLCRFAFLASGYNPIAIPAVLEVQQKIQHRKEQCHIHLSW